MTARFGRRGLLHRSWGLILCAAGGMAVPAGAAPAPTPLAAKPADEKTRTLQEALDRKMPGVNFDGVALADAIDFLRDVTGTSFSVDWTSLERAGVKRDTPVRIRVRGVTFAQALTAVLDSAGGAGKLAYRNDGGVIRITAAQHR